MKPNILVAKVRAELDENAAFWRDVVQIFRDVLHERGMTDEQIDTDLRKRPAPRKRRR